MQYASLRGIYDVMPPESELWRVVEKKAYDIFSTYGYQEIKIPMLEKTALFARGVGEATAVVEKEMYTFTDKGGDEVSLRPEGTAPVVRAYVEHKVYVEEPVAKYFYFGPMFRYERPQKGRNRQFYQIGVEALGVDSALIDAEVIAMGEAFLKSLGLKDFQVEINSLGCPECRPGYLELFKKYLDKTKDDFCDDCKRRMEKNPMRVLDCKSEVCKSLLIKAPLIGAHLCSACKEHFLDTKKYLDKFGVKYIVNEKIVRGLDYYMRTAFEITTDKLGAQNAILAGGRYDGLVKSLGGPNIPGIGFALGVERLVLLIEENNPEFKPKAKEVVFFALLDSGILDRIIPIIQTLRKDGVAVELDYSCKSLKSQMRKADKFNAHSVVIIGEDEIKKGVVTIRDMKTKEQREVAFDKIVYHFVEIGG